MIEVISKLVLFKKNKGVIDVLFPKFRARYKSVQCPSFYVFHYHVRNYSWYWRAHCCTENLLVVISTEKQGRGASHLSRSSSFGRCRWLTIWCGLIYLSTTPVCAEWHQNILYFLHETKRLYACLEGLNSSPTPSAGELWPSAKMAKITFCRTWFLPKFCLFGDNFWTRNARKLKVLYYSLVSNKYLSQKIGSWCWCPKGALTSAKNVQIYPSYDITHKKCKIQNFPIFQKI